MAKSLACVVAMLVGSGGCGGAAAPPPATAVPAPVIANPAPPPPPPAESHAACAEVARHLVSRPFEDDRLRSAILSEGANQAEHFVPAMTTACVEDQWPGEVRDCIATMRATQDSERCLDMMTSVQRDGLRVRVENAVTPGTPAAAGVGTLPQDCQDYRDAIYALASCPKMPHDAAQQMKDAFDQAAQSWGALPPDAKQSLATACKTGADAIRTAATNMGCP